ncbi:MBL fold metallo-hydrolase [Candidatus Woesearchaeota archaeon]|nr:MBL fold metallo-hydrolase [Candidatus Woesearchaeota archaeon]
MANIDGISIEWFGHDAFRINSDDKIIYIDPFNVSAQSVKADVIFVTHEHFDHCSLDDIKKIATQNTTIVTVPECQSKISKLVFKKFVLVEPNKKYDVDGLQFSTIPAYNINKFRSQGVAFHPKADNHVGYIINISGKIVYHSGDTDATPEMLSLTNTDIALVPVSGTYAMTADEAADAVNAFKPVCAIPMHWGSIVGSRADAERFKMLAQVRVEILDAVKE